MNVITPTAAQRASTPSPTIGTTPLGQPKAGNGRVQVAEAKSKEKYAGIAANDQKFEDFAAALTGKTADERTPDENRALAQLRKEMADGTVDPTFVEADPANGAGDDKLPPGARGAFVKGAKGAQGRVLISGTLRGQQLQKTSDEEQGEALADRARQLGIGVADGDAGARVSGVANGKQITRQSDAALFRDQKSDTITVIADGKRTVAEADAGPVDNSYIRNLDDPEKRTSYLLQFDKNADGWLNRHELAEALQTTPEHAARFIRIYGIGLKPGEEYQVPIHNSQIDGIGVDDMIADGSLAPNTDLRTEYLWTDLKNVKPATLAKAMFRAATARLISDGDTRPYEVILGQLESSGMSAEQMSWTAEWIFGDRKPLMMSNGHANKIAENFGSQGIDGQMNINISGMLQIWQQGALQIKEDKIGFVAISAHREPMPIALADDHVPSGIDRATNTYTAFTLNFTDLMLPSDSKTEPANGLGIYRPPYMQFSSLGFGWNRQDEPIAGDSMLREPELDANGVATGNVIWTFIGTNKSYYKNEPVTFTVPAGSAQDRYLLNYRAFSTLPSVAAGNENRPIANVLKSGEVVSSSSGSRVEIWTPREHQFNAHANGRPARVEDKPIITVDGQLATIQSIQRVKLSNVQGDSYTVTVKTATGRTETFIHSPKTTPETAAFKNADILVNGGIESTAIDLAGTGAVHASVLAGETVSGSGIVYANVKPETAVRLDAKLSAFLGRPVTAADIPALLKAGHIRAYSSTLTPGYVVLVPNEIAGDVNGWPAISEEEYLRGNPTKLPPGKKPADIFPLYQTPNLLVTPHKKGNVEIIPHRGVFTLGKGVPENSLASITAAIGKKPNQPSNHSSTEVDIMYTKDGVAILAHDTTPGRVLAKYRNRDGSAKQIAVTDAVGRPVIDPKTGKPKTRPILWSDLTWKEIKDQPVIINEQDPNTGKYTGRYTVTDQKIASLEQALDHAIKINPNATVFLDARNMDAAKAIAWLAANPKYQKHVAVKTYANQYNNADAVLKQVDAIIDADKTTTAAEKAQLKATARKDVHIVPVLTADQTIRLAGIATGKKDPTDAERTAAGIAWFKTFDDAKMNVAAREIPIETIGEYYNPVTKMIEATPRRRDGSVSPLPTLTSAEVEKVNSDKSLKKNLLDMFEGDSAQIDIFSHFNKTDPKTPVMQSYRADDYETADGEYGVYDWQTGLPVPLDPGLPSLGRFYRATPGALAHYGNWFITDRPLEEKAYLVDQKDGKDDIVETRENPTLDLDPDENLNRGPR